MPLPRYMHLCLSHPTLGYYARMRDQSGSSILGARGDFITSPEISQVFGEVSQALSYTPGA
jgi:NADH dehydrogenase [ubiquinone] 1 alpha subcomplex assembly factor 7